MSSQHITLLPEGVRQWLTENQGETGYVLSVEKISVGQSNPTFILKTPSDEFILRTQPEGDLLPSAHAVDREYRVMSALKDTDVPVPTMISLCDDKEQYGVKFFLMEKVQGETLLDPSLPQFNSDDRRQFYRQKVDVLSSLSKLNPEDLHLSDFGKPLGYIDRQIAIWTKQYRAAETEIIPAMDVLIEQLKGQFDEALVLPNTVIHGDFRQDNLIVHHHPDKKINAVIDWELSTLGPVFVDLSYWCAMLRMKHNWAIGGLGEIDRSSLGIPDEDELIDLFCRNTGLNRPKQWELWIAFQLFRFAAILQGIRKRHLDGNASAHNAEAVGAQAIPVAKLAEKILENN